jgi:hypothetical protein
MMKENSSLSLAGSAASVPCATDGEPRLLEMQNPVSLLLLISQPSLAHMWRKILKF